MSLRQAKLTPRLAVICDMVVGVVCADIADNAARRHQCGTGGKTFRQHDRIVPFAEKQNCSAGNYHQGGRIHTGSNSILF